MIVRISRFSLERFVSTSPRHLSKSSSSASFGATGGNDSISDHASLSAEGSVPPRTFAQHGKSKEVFWKKDDFS
jgi:hypothetical protein